MKRYAGSSVVPEFQTKSFCFATYVREQSEIEAMRSAGPAREYRDAVRPLLSFLEELLKQDTLDDISIRREGLALSLRRENGTT